MQPEKTYYTPGSSNIAGWKMDQEWVDVFPIEKWDYSSQLCLLKPEGNQYLTNVITANFFGEPIFFVQKKHNIPPKDLSFFNATGKSLVSIHARGSF